MNLSDWPLDNTREFYLENGPTSLADLARHFDVNENLGRFIQETLLLMGLLLRDRPSTYTKISCILKAVQPTQHQVDAFMTALRTRMVRDVDERLGGGSGAQVFSVEDRLK